MADIFSAARMAGTLEGKLRYYDAFDPAIQLAILHGYGRNLAHTAHSSFYLSPILLGGPRHESPFSALLRRVFYRKPDTTLMSTDPESRSYLGY